MNSGLSLQLRRSKDEKPSLRTTTIKIIHCQHKPVIAIARLLSILRDMSLLSVLANGQFMELLHGLSPIRASLRKGYAVHISL